jgi:hypothetical protein
MSDVRKQRVIGVCGGHGRDRRRPRTVGVWGNAGGSSTRDGIQAFSTDERRVAMGIDWMTGAELSQAIPPAYSKWIGEQMLQRIGQRTQTLEAIQRCSSSCSCSGWSLERGRRWPC